MLIFLILQNGIALCFNTEENLISNTSTTLAILAGGKATRLGGINKGLISIDGETVIKKIYKTLSPLFIETIIIGNGNIDYELPLVKIFPDIITNTGPLGGIHSALSNSSNTKVFIVPCDMPFVDPAIASKIIDSAIENDYEAVIPKIETLIEPMFALYFSSLIPKIEKLIRPNHGKSITDLLKKSKTKYINLPMDEKSLKCFTNVNTLEDLIRLKIHIN